MGPAPPVASSRRSSLWAVLWALSWPAGFLGTASRNLLLGPTFNNWDFSVTKEFPILKESARRLEFRAEIFNLLNRDNFNIPVEGRTVFTADGNQVSQTALATAGQITRTAGDSRQIQFALKLIF